jgi:hypothetical protein
MPTSLYIIAGSSILDCIVSIDFFTVGKMFILKLININIKRSKLKKGRVNDIDINKFEYKHFPNCKKSMETIQSRMELPAMMYKDVGIDRFYDLPKNPQRNIFWDFSIETRNDAKDKYMPQKPKQIDNNNMFMLDY